MNLRAEIRGLSKAVKRLEAAAGKGQRHYAYRRLYLRQSGPDPKKPKPQLEDVFKAKCQFCGSEFNVHLEGLCERDREMRRLTYSFPFKTFRAPARRRPE